MSFNYIQNSGTADWVSVKLTDWIQQRADDWLQGRIVAFYAIGLVGKNIRLIGKEFPQKQVMKSQSENGYYPFIFLVTFINNL